MLTAVDPAKRDTERTKIEPPMFDFRPSLPRAPDRVSFSGTRVTRARPWVRPFPSRLGAPQVSQGLALLFIKYPNMYPGFEATLGLLVRVRLPSPRGDVV
jgi:hypothetical protein